MKAMLAGLALAVALALAWPAPAVDSGAAVELRPFVRGSWQALRRAHAGQPTVVHFWGLTCGPCLAELPSWGRLVRERPDMTLVLVDADPVPDERAGVIATLARDGLSGVESWLFDDRFEERLRFEIDPRWQGEMPHTVMLGRDGRSVTITGVADLREVRAWLDAQKKVLR